MVAYTQHPQAQVTPCWCDSGERFIDCHLAPHVYAPCGCQSGRASRECCAVVKRYGMEKGFAPWSAR